MYAVWVALMVGGLFSLYLVGSLGYQEQQRHTVNQTSMMGSMVAYYKCLQDFHNNNPTVQDQTIPVANVAAACPPIMGYDPSDGTPDDIFTNYIDSTGRLFVYSVDQDAALLATRATPQLYRYLGTDREFGVKIDNNQWRNGRDGQVLPFSFPVAANIPDQAVFLTGDIP